MQSEIIKSKRGRPRKNININREEITKMLVNKQEEIVLFLPITFDDDIEQVNILKQTDKKNIFEEKVIIKTENLPEKKNEFIDIKSNNVINESILFACWWCTYEYDNKSYFIPDRCDESTYYVFGYFCSPNCALAYNLDQDDYKSLSRNALIEKLYGKIISAPDWKCLKKFGGNLTIEEFRNSFITKQHTSHLIYRIQ